MHVNLSQLQMVSVVCRVPIARICAEHGTAGEWQVSRHHRIDGNNKHANRETARVKSC
jgi:hypothetical protein